MSLLKISNAFLLLVFAFSTAKAQYDFSLSSVSQQKENAKLELSNKLVSGETTLGKMTFTDEKKSSALAGVLSAVVPGAGQFYAKSFVKSAVFLGIEAGLWVVYAVFQGKGNDQTTFYQNYANTNWDVRRYAQWLVDQNFSGSSGINPNNPDLNALRLSINNCESQNFSHTLPPYGDQQYYEVIGKYQNYVTGWQEAIGQPITKNNYGTWKLNQVDYYMTERQQANTYYNVGTYSLIAVMANHIVSAIDAVITVNSKNEKLRLKGSVSFEPIYSFRQDRTIVTPFAHLSVNF
ncbi:MAG: hypothetical protein NTV87_05010 [Ignavibacteriae bacterium]|nr:hypothetical protein [Ignavibacteriota bacterium]